MKKVTIKEYAVKYKLSIFNVMKMVRSGKLNSEEKEEGDKKSIYILLDEKTEEEVRDGIVAIESNTERTLKEEMSILQDEIKSLRVDIEALQNKIKYG